VGGADCRQAAANLQRTEVLFETIKLVATRLEASWVQVASAAERLGPWQLLVKKNAHFAQELANSPRVSQVYQALLERLEKQAALAATLPAQLACGMVTMVLVQVSFFLSLFLSFFLSLSLSPTENMTEEE
jgi:hypothetical protein